MKGTLTHSVLVALSLGAGSLSATTVTVGSATGAPGSTLAIPVSVDSVTGLLALELTLSFDAARLTVTDVRPGLLTSGFAHSFQLSGGAVRVAMASGTAVSGSGTLAVVTAVIAPAAPPGSTSVGLSGVLLNDQPTSGVAGSVTVQAAARHSSILPSSAFRAGLNEADFRTDVRVFNPSGAEVSVTPTFYDQATGQTSPGPAFRLGPRSQAAFDNVLAALFSRTREQASFGPIRFSSDQRILVSARVINVNGCRAGATQGQWLPGLDPGAALTRSIIPQVAVSASSSSGNRTNLIVMNPGSAAASPVMTLRRGDGALIASTALGTLGANGFRQLALDSATFPELSGVTDENLYLEIVSEQPVLAFTSVINNVSGDPFAVVAVADGPPGPE